MVYLLAVAAAAYCIWVVVYLSVTLTTLLIIMIFGPELLFLLLYAFTEITGLRLPIAQLLGSE